ncbi:hypothetical protein [Streptococcus anginosus]|uniref:Replication protein RepA n=1 Tax=Streptococcus anginosus TaxID=1328 RepID=A0A3S5E1W5_STRAP|nr:hypothetical protein [Streptococcus anginosus]EGL47692.1 hypothetical protein HMPREF9966_1472 [Streptococcus anginosus SK52 = DSM 20563]MBZ2158110.1 replication protein RepA [Streptococcus anginosus]ORE81609.1 replication protein RepA [Streptococcus anginosus SK52 = DSM 20563]UEB01701.1 replication protein RepA [Streptococcus anginosus subsp. anginosus]VED98582.1 replication protein RepA [Streptococcus anginosus]
MTNSNISSDFRANSFCCVLNNVDKLFDKESDFFDSDKYKEKTKKRIQEFRKLLPDTNEPLSPEEIVDFLMERWIARNENVVCAINYEIGDNGVHHCHMVLEDKKAFRFSALQKLYPTIHAEITRGTKEQIIAYLEKSGEHEEKAHTIVVPMKVHGELRARNQGHRSDFDYIQKQIENGATPEEIMMGNLEYRKYSKMIREHFFQHRLAQTPDIKDMKVYWHVGESGSGKSHTQVNLKKEFGRDNVYIWTDFDNGGLDLYCAEPILFMDEFKGMSYKEFLKVTDVYPVQLHARYTNTIALWNEIHITSIFTPKEAYGLMVPESQQEIDSYKQLQRRLTNVIYHFKIREDDGNFKYKTITFTPEDFERHKQEQIEKFAYLFDKFNPNVLNYDFTKDAFHLSMNPINNKKKKATTLKLTKAESNSK